MRLDIRPYTRALDASLRRRGTKIERAVVRGLNDVAFDLRRSEVKAIPRIFDRPTPFTERGPMVVRAKVGNPRATFLIKDRQARYLGVQERGGRSSPRFDKKGNRKKVSIPREERILNAFGSMGRNAVAKLVKQPGHFVARMKNQEHGGVFRRTTNKRLPIEMVVAFRDFVDYQPEYNFVTRNKNLGERKLSPALNRRLARALR
jgi:hypothetical protein